MKVQVVVGGQFGSEAKGHVTRQLVDREIAQQRTVINIRVAGPNAGHCAYDENGNRWALRQVPVGATSPVTGYVIPYIASGSEIDLPVLLDEIDQMDAAGLRVSNRLIVSPEATMLYDEHKMRESKDDLVAKVGSTGKGIGAARADRIMRTANRLMDDSHARQELENRGVGVGTLDYDRSNMSNTTVVIEGTQGYGLGLHAGFYPQCTSSDARAIDFLAMAGVNPWRAGVTGFEVWVVARVYPIRVAGNSGPLADETTWEDLGLPPEMTTVTHKVRRVGGWDGRLVRNAVQANGGAPVVRLALTMVDQKFPWIDGVNGDYIFDLANVVDNDLIQGLDDFVAKVEDEVHAPVRMVTTSPTTALWREKI